MFGNETAAVLVSQEFPCAHENPAELPFRPWVFNVKEFKTSKTPECCLLCNDPSYVWWAAPGFVLPFSLNFLCSYGWNMSISLDISVGGTTTVYKQNSGRKFRQKRAHFTWPKFGCITLWYIVAVHQYIRSSFNFSSVSPENVLYWALAKDLRTWAQSALEWFRCVKAYVPTF